MKKVIFIIAILTLCNLKGFGQIVKMDSVIVATVGSGGFFKVYYGMQESGDIGGMITWSKNVVKLFYPSSVGVNIYNLDGTNYKSLSLPHPTGTTLSTQNSLIHMSTHLFNDDDLIEIIYEYYISGVYTTIVVNENLDVLYEFSGLRVESFLSTPNSETLLIMRNNTWSSHSIYKIAQVKTGISQTKIQLQKLPFPNPSKTTVNLPYQLSLGQQATMKIFDVNGKSIATKQIDASFDRLQLDVSNYSKGMYLYEYNGKSGKFVVE